MRSLGWVLVGTLTLVGCRAGFKSASGGATSPDGLGRGATHSLRFYDEGGLLTRAALAGLGVVAAAGAVENRKTTYEINQTDTGTVINRTDTGTINTDTAKGAAGIMNAAGDPNTSFGTANGSLAASLELASTTLGGDTSGGQFDFGYSYKYLQKMGNLGLAIRGYAGFGYGHYTFHERVMVATDRGPPKFGDGTYKFLGIPARIGAFLFAAGGKFTTMVGVEAYAKLDINFSDAMVYHLGGRFQYSLGFVELEMMRGSKSDLGSVGLEIGIGF